MIRLPTLTAIALVAGPLAAQPQPAASPAKPPELSADQRAQVSCSAVFAVTAAAQARGDEAALAYPPMKVRGREYFVRIGARTMDATGAGREAIKALLEGEVARLQQAATASGDPAAVLGAALRPCLPRLDAEVPPLPKPSLAQCTAIMKLAFEEVYAREGLQGAEARDLKVLSAVLEDRQRKALQAEALSGDAIDRRISEAHDAMLKEALDSGPGVEKYDLSVCYDFAKPDPAKHY